MDTAKCCAMDTIEVFVQSTEKVTAAAAIAAVTHSPPNPPQLQESCTPQTPLTLWWLQDQEQKLRFLQSICTICDTEKAKNMAQELRVFCHRKQLVEKIMELLSEEPRGKLCSGLRQQAMAAITTLSAVEAVREDKIPLLTVCFQSILLLPLEQDLDIGLFSRTLRALDQMLHTLVFVHPTASIGEELRSVFQVLLPFTCLQSAAVRQRAVGRIWKLSHSLALFCQAGPHRSLGRISLACYSELHLPMLGQLVGSLVLCCAYQDDRTCCSALNALRHLYAFILRRTRWEVQQEVDQEKLQQWEDDHEFSLSWTTNTMVIVQRFAKHFQPSEKTDFILVALQGMRDCSIYNTYVAAAMMAVLMNDFKPKANDVQRIMMAIHKTRKQITDELAQKTIQGAFPWLATSDPHAMTLSLLHCSPTCDKDAWELWDLTLSSANVVPQMLRELLQLLEMAPQGQETEIGILPLAATMALHEIVQHSQYSPEVRMYFPELFVALIMQTVSAMLTPLEVTNALEDPFCPSAPTSAIRLVVEVLRKLLLCVGLEHVANIMERQKLWGQLLGTGMWRDGLHNLARAMVKNCRDPCTRVFRHVQKMLQSHQLQWREVPAMVLYTELQGCQELHEEKVHADILKKHIRSERPESQELALHGLRILYARRMHLLLPDVLTWLQDTRADVKLQAMQLLCIIMAQHPNQLGDTFRQLAVHLLSCFNEDNAELRCFSMELFVQLLVVPGRRWLLPQAKMGLLPLFFHLNEEIPRVARAAQKALMHTAKLLDWQRLQHLASAADTWKIADCLVQKAGSAEYVEQSMWYLHNPQASVREAAVRFLGLLGRRLKKNPQKVQDICKALKSMEKDSELAIMALAFIFALLMQTLPRAGDELDKGMLDRMQQREVCLQEQMTKLLQEVEHLDHSGTGTQALLFSTPLTYWSYWRVLHLFILLLWLGLSDRKSRPPKVEGSSDDESSCSEEEDQEVDHQAPPMEEEKEEEKFSYLESFSLGSPEPSKEMNVDNGKSARQTELLAMQEFDH
ncbi:hypothetical protein ASZ78_007559 [Callipepla squamata]|uniref:Uncharacterized protein n=1 Tax=Callipepla squamata TaxID=9009 RepID=A0A226MDW3_CALSU|nr:hypothetical protein ASZ78_007559 [Callipepla squamata]